MHKQAQTYIDLVLPMRREFLTWDFTSADGRPDIPLAVSSDPEGFSVRLEDRPIIQVKMREP